MHTVLITGGTGLIGKQLSSLLISKGYNVIILSRKASKNSNIFFWNVKNKIIEDVAILKSDYIIHLAGAGIADKRWTKKIKKEIIDSRVDSTRLLFNKVKTLNHPLKGFISAGGIGYYGTETSEKIYNEGDAHGNDFLAKTCTHWEQASNLFSSLKIRTVILRTGVVLTKKGGALGKMSLPIKYGIGSTLGKGKQYIPWIHIDDLCNIYLDALQNQKIKGIINAVAPTHITNKELTLEIAKLYQKKIWLPPIPKQLIKIFFGQMAVILLEGSRVSSEKIQSLSFKFKFPKIQEALQNLIH